MSDHDQSGQDAVSRRQFLRQALALGLGVSGAGLLSACGGSAPETPAAATSAPAAAATSAPAAAATSAPVAAATSAPAAAGGGKDMVLWWWGEQEAAGLTGWLDSAIGKFKEQSGHSIEPTLMDTDQVISQFATAAASGNPPDIQFLWNGIYHMENVWLGYLDALNGLLPDDLLQSSGATSLSIFEQKQYRVGWYSIGFGMPYNKEMFDKAGLNADDPPKTWDQLLAACDKLKSSGVTPIGGGVKDGYFGEFYLVQGLTQNLNSPDEAIKLFVGDLDWRDPKYHEHWVKLEELHKNKFINDDINSLELYQGIQLVDTGKAAMTISPTTLLPSTQKALGAEKVGYMVMPVFGKGKMAGIPILDAQGFGIPSKAGNKPAAADFLKFIQQPEQLNSLWSEVKQIPANKNFDGAQINDPLIKMIWEKWVKGTSNVYIANLMPTLFWSDAMFVASQKILSGELTGDASGDLAHDITQKWKEQNPDMVGKYGQWAKDLSA